MFSRRFRGAAADISGRRILIISVQGRSFDGRFSSGGLRKTESESADGTFVLYVVNQALVEMQVFAASPCM